MLHRPIETTGVFGNYDPPRISKTHRLSIPLPAMRPSEMREIANRIIRFPDLSGFPKKKIWEPEKVGQGSAPNRIETTNARLV